jgi:hypothetical protein
VCVWGVEDIDHMLFKFDWAREIWNALGLISADKSAILKD